MMLPGTSNPSSSPNHDHDDDVQSLTPFPGLTAGSSASPVSQFPESANMSNYGADSGGLGLSSMNICKDPGDSCGAVADDDGCSWTSSSSESSTVSGLIGARKEQIIGKITLAVTQWLRYQFTHPHQSVRDIKDSSCEGGESTSSDMSAQFPTDQVGQAGKRKLSDIDNDNGGNNDKNIVRPLHPGTDHTEGNGKEIVRFACPYFKYNPTKYQQWPICPGPGWSDVHQVKEHLYSKHRQPKFRCARCWECFGSEQNYLDHWRAIVLCELRDREPVEGFDAGQERRLRSRKKNSHIVSETDKWNAIYQILFPHVASDEIPPPFHGHETQTHEALTECEEYILREIPLRLREILALEFDRDFQIIEQSLQMRATESTRTIVTNLFQEFRNLYRQGMLTGGSQPYESSTSSQTRPSWLDSMDSSEIFLGHTGFDFDSALAVDETLSLFGDV